MCRFEDSRGWCCAAYNEVAIDYNAAFTGALARLVDWYADSKPASDCGLALGWEHPNATLVRARLFRTLPHAAIYVSGGHAVDHICFTHPHDWRMHAPINPCTLSSLPVRA